MKVQTKITLLLVLIVATFVAAIVGYQAHERMKFRRISEERFVERKRAFEQFLDRHGANMRTYVEDTSCWDALIDSLGKHDNRWLADNFNQSTLDGYHFDAIWLVAPDGTVGFAVDHLYASEALPLPVPATALAAIFSRSPFAHFFARLPQGLVELEGATIHPTRDFHRQSPAAGYLLAGRLWSNAELDEIARYTGNEITLVDPGERVHEIRDSGDGGAVLFVRTLTSWDNHPLAKLVVRNDSRILTEFNRSSRELLLELAVLGLILLLLISGSLVRWVRRPLRTIMDGLQSNDAGKVQPLLSDGSEFGELARTVNQFFQQRENLIREMDERRATERALRSKEDELRQSQKMEAIGRLAGGVAHDFNNLLTAIIGYAELITMRYNGSDTVVKQHAEGIKRAGQQAAKLTRQLLAFSRKQVLQPAVIDLNALVTDMQVLLRRLVGERFRFDVQPLANESRVKADPTQVEQVILNLAVNARDAMPDGGKLTIRTDNVSLDADGAAEISPDLAPGDYVVLSVSDTGVGMNAETKARVFEPFFTTKAPGEGTGLGLATVYGIVRQSGGGISVETELGAGTTFRIYFQVEMSPVEAMPLEPEPDTATFTSEETILVVEDDRVVRELVCSVLSDDGYKILCAPNGHAAIDLSGAHSGEIDLLVTDVVMPSLNGPELAAHLVISRPEMKVLYVSGYSANDFGGILAPEIELLQKPFTPQELLRKVREVLGGKWNSRVRDDPSQLRFTI